MARQVVELITVLAKLQASAGTMETLLTSANLMQPMKPSYSLDPAESPIDLVSAGFGQMPSVIGAYDVGQKMSFPLRPSGVQGVPGDWAIALQACGFKQTPVGNVYSYAPANKDSEWKRLTMWAYSGNLDTSSAILAKLGDLMYNGKITIDFDKALAILELDGKGRFEAAPAAGTQPTVSRVSTAVPPVRGATISIMGVSTFVPLTFELDFGQDISMVRNPAVTSGNAFSVLVKRKMKWSAKVYQDLPASGDPVAQLIAATTGAMSIAWGKFTVAATSGQITKVGQSDQNGVQTYDISGPVIENDVTISLDTTV
jgi:hypothetical protein